MYSEVYETLQMVAIALEIISKAFSYFPNNQPEWNVRTVDKLAINKVT